MAGNRAAAQAWIIKAIGETSNEDNSKIWADRLSAMSDAQFAQFMQGLKAKTTRLAVVIPNLGNTKTSTQRNLDFGKRYKVPHFQHLSMVGADGTRYVTPEKYPVLLLPFRRQAQLLVKKISIPEDNRSVDDMTGQPTGKSKGSKISYPELQILAARDLSFSVLELIKYRGGDEKGFNATNRFIGQTGHASQAAVEPFSGGVKSTQTLKTILTSMHFDTKI